MAVEKYNLERTADRNVCPTRYPLPSTHSGKACPADHGRRTADSRRSRRGFTLIELLIVFAILVVLLAASAPMLRMFTGKRSIEAAQNQVAAALETARSQAITLHEIRGVLFVLDMQPQVNSKTGQFVVDPATSTDPTRPVYAPTGQIKAIMVRASGPKQPDAAFAEAYGVEVFLDGAGMDPILLPYGVMLQTIINCQLNSQTTPARRLDDNYLGFNQFKIGNATPPDQSIPVGGVILFDADGRLATVRYSFRLGYDPGDSYRRSELGDMIFPGLRIDKDRYYEHGFPKSLFGQDFNPPMAPYSSVGLVLCDRAEFDAIGTLDDPKFTPIKSPSPALPDPHNNDNAFKNSEYMGQKGSGHTSDYSVSPWGNEEIWLDEHAVPLLINRVTGAVIKGE